MSGLGRGCPDCGGALTDGHDDGRDLVEVWCDDCGEEWASAPGGWARLGSPEAESRYAAFSPTIVILPGGLLGRVTGHDADGLPIVNRWHHGLAFTGWRAFGVEVRPLPAESPEGHPSYLRALARLDEVTS